LMKMWKTIFYCVLIPTLWSFFVYSIYVAMSFIFIWNTPIWDEWGSYFGRDFYSINSYFDYLFKSRAWFISLPLIFLCLAYCRFSKPALPKPKTTD
jgi:hypothetical protein